MELQTHSINACKYATHPYVPTDIGLKVLKMLRINKLDNDEDLHRYGNNERVNKPDSSIRQLV